MNTNFWLSVRQRKDDPKSFSNSCIAENDIIEEDWEEEEEEESLKPTIPTVIEPWSQRLRMRKPRAQVVVHKRTGLHKYIIFKSSSCSHSSKRA